MTTRKSDVQPLVPIAAAAAIHALFLVTPATSSPRRTVPKLLSHEDRQELIRKPFHIAYIPSVKRWGGVQLGPDDMWDEVTERFFMRRRYADRFEMEE